MGKQVDGELVALQEQLAMIENLYKGDQQIRAAGVLMRYRMKRAVNRTRGKDSVIGRIKKMTGNNEQRCQACNVVMGGDRTGARTITGWCHHECEKDCWRGLEMAKIPIEEAFRLIAEGMTSATI